MTAPWIRNMSEEEARKRTPGPNEICISITDPLSEDDPALVGYVDIRRLRFHDVDPAVKELPAFMKPCSEAQASRIVLFALRHRGRNIVVHCAAGISRSGAVVDAILQAFPEYEDRGELRMPNGHVKALLKRVFGLVPLGAEEGK